MSFVNTQANLVEQRLTLNSKPSKKVCGHIYVNRAGLST